VIGDVKLYGYWRSSSSWRVRIALGHKGIPYTLIPVDLLAGEGEQWSAAHRARSPAGKIPVLELVHEGRPQRVIESMAILELLDELVPSPPLLPRHPFDRAHVRGLAELVNSGIQPLQNTSVTKHVGTVLAGDKTAWAAHWNRVGLQALERAVAPRAGRFCFGDDVTLADVLLAPQIYSARRFAVDLTDFPTLTRIDAALAALPAFQAAHADAQPDKPTQVTP
jgi:maleylpyruvate isomerase